MTHPDLLHWLIDSIYPQLETQGGAHAALRGLVLACAGKVASARGLSPGKVLADDEATSMAQDLLAEVAFEGARFTLPGDLYARLLADRHQRGSYYTPLPLARWVVQQTLTSPHTLSAHSTHPRGGGSQPRPLTQDGYEIVLDPAMGGGHFLIAAGEVLAGEGASLEDRWQAVGRLYGIENDPFAARLARISLWLWCGLADTTPDDLAGRLVCGDALLDDFPAFPGQFSVVVGNPPYASVFTRAGDANGVQDAIRKQYETAQGSFDLSVPFVERALNWCVPGGRIGLVLPNKILAASYAAGLRDWVAERAVVEVLADYAGSSAFAADVYPVVLVARRIDPSPVAGLTVFRADGRLDAPEVVRQGSQRDLRDVPGGSWSAALDPDWGDLRACLEGTRPLEKVAGLSAGLTVSEAYDLRERVIDVPFGALPGDGVRLITTGVIERHHTTWGQKTSRYLKRTFRYPAVMVHALPERRQRQARRPKIIVAGLAKRPRAFVDGGLAQASVSTIIISEAAWPLGALSAVLNSDLMARLYRALYGGLALSGGYLRFGQRELATLPIPNRRGDDPCVRQLDKLARDMAHTDAAGRREIDAEIDRLVAWLYGVGAGSEC